MIALFIGYYYEPYVLAMVMVAVELILKTISASPLKQPQNQPLNTTKRLISFLLVTAQ